MDRVGVRELRQNLSVYLKRVKDGRELEVTERGRVVARLVPPGRGSLIDDYVARGWATLPRHRLSDLGPPPLATPGPSMTEVLRELRDEERR